MQYVTLTQHGPIYTVTLNAPKIRNALVHDLKVQLCKIIQMIENDSNVEVVIFTGVDDAFCAGGDIKAMLQPYDANKIFESMTISTTMIQKIRAIKAITIAAVNGHAAGAGFSIALAMDYIISEQQAKWILAFKNVGLIPDLGLHYYLVNAVGEKRAKEWIFEGKTLTSEECLAYGIINEVVEKGASLTRAQQYAQILLEGPIKAFIHSKLLINEQSGEILNSMMNKENAVQTLLRDSATHYKLIEKWRPSGGAS